MNYLTHDGHHLSTKNKLQKEVQDYLISIDRQLLEGNFKMALFKREVLEKIKELNEKHSRCKPIQASWWQPTKHDYHLSGVNFSHYYIYHSKNTY